VDGSAVGFIFLGGSGRWCFSRTRHVRSGGRTWSSPAPPASRLLLGCWQRETVPGIAIATSTISFFLISCVLLPQRGGTFAPPGCATPSPPPGGPSTLSAGWRGHGMPGAVPPLPGGEQAASRVLLRLLPSRRGRGSAAAQAGFPFPYTKWCITLVVKRARLTRDPSLVA
jgi:hypothetical protein